MIQPLEAFCFLSPTEWPKWKERFEYFYAFSGLGTKPEEHQVDTLLHIMGDKAKDIFGTFKLIGEDSKMFSVVMEHFDKYFISHRNVIFERALFNTRVQQEAESVEEMTTVLYAAKNGTRRSGKRHSHMCGDARNS